MKPCSVVHPTTDPACRLCWLADHDDMYRRAWGIVTPKPVFTPFSGETAAALHLLGIQADARTLTRTNDTPQTPYLPQPCPYEGAELSGQQRQTAGKSHTKRWKFCLHPDKPLGEIVCSCTGCGPQCRGYPKDLTPPEARPKPKLLVKPTLTSPRPVATQTSMPVPAPTPPTVPNSQTHPVYASPTQMDPRTSGLRWVYGVTTVPDRRDDLLPRTLASLKAGGFERPHLFVDGAGDQESWYREFGLDVTCRYPRVRTAGNWVLSLYELYYRMPNADRFAVFQDDLVCLVNLRGYLDRIPYPPRAYLNLFTAGSNQDLCPKGYTGFYKSNQLGKGAVALVFDRPAVMTLLTGWHLVERVQDAGRGAFRAIDGGIVDTMTQAKYVEMVHSPSLVEHTGAISAMGNLPHNPSRSFPGERVDALSLLPQPTVTKVGG